MFGRSFILRDQQQRKIFRISRVGVRVRPAVLASPTHGPQSSVINHQSSQWREIGTVNTEKYVQNYCFCSLVSSNHMGVKTLIIGGK